MSASPKQTSEENDSTSVDISLEEDDFLLPWENLLQYLSIKHIEKLSLIFKEANENLEYSREDFIISPSAKLSKEDFVRAIDSVIGNCRFSLQAQSLYDEIPYPEDDKITWDQFLDYYISHAISYEDTRIELSNLEIYFLPHIKREPITKIVLIESDTFFCYAVVSKYGNVGLYTGDLKLFAIYKVMFTRTDKNYFDKYSQKKTAWITDAIFLPNVCIFAVSTSARSIMFYDASGQKHTPLWLIEGIPNVVNCLTYHSDCNSKLFMGDDIGTVRVIKFLQQKDGLFRKKYSDKLSSYFWRELKDETAFVTIEYFKNIHSNVILSIMYYPETYSFISCSRDSKKSLVIFNIKERKANYTFKISQGIKCFSISHDLHLLLTGCDNGSVQLWNLFVTSKPISILQEHKSEIVDVQIFSFKNAALTCSCDGILKLWNLKTYICEYTTFLNFPSFGVLGKRIEWGTKSIYPGPKRNINENENNLNVNEDLAFLEHFTKKGMSDPWKRSSILITCCNYIGKININFEKININDENNSILPPPPMQNKVLIPESWKIDENALNDVDIESKEINKSLLEPENWHAQVKYVMEQKYFKERIKKHDINYKIASMETKKSEMLKIVAQCAPYLALDLCEVEDVKLSSNLPIPDNKKTQQIAEKTMRLLSAASNRSDILSDRSSKSKSSRSSIIEF